MHNYTQRAYVWHYILCVYKSMYGSAGNPIARPGTKKTNVSVRMAWISFGAMQEKKKAWWQLASRCCWNRARPWHACELVSFLVGLRSYQHPGVRIRTRTRYTHCLHGLATGLLNTLTLYFTLLYFSLSASLFCFFLIHHCQSIAYDIPLFRYSMMNEVQKY